MKFSLKRHRPFSVSLLISAVLIAIFLFFYNTKKDTDVINITMVSCALIAAVAFWVEYRQNNKINEAQFVMSLNNEFITSEKMTAVEHNLERYYALVLDGEDTKEFEKKLRETYDIEKPKRQDLVNYLVHLEGIATMINTGILRLSTINDLMAYRFFIAVNNPVVQEMELFKYKAYYHGIVELYPVWAKKMKDMPLEGSRLVG
jgi:hypothetical protein